MNIDPKELERKHGVPMSKFCRLATILRKLSPQFRRLDDGTYFDPEEIEGAAVKALIETGSLFRAKWAAIDLIRSDLSWSTRRQLDKAKAAGDWRSYAKDGERMPAPEYGFCMERLEDRDDDEVVSPLLVSHSTQEEQVIFKQDYEALCAAIAELPPRERYVIRTRDLSETPGREVAKEMGVHESRVIQIRNEAIKRLRKKLLSKESPKCRITTATS